MTDHDTILAILQLAGVPHVARHWPATGGLAIGNHHEGVPWQFWFRPDGALMSAWGVFPTWRYDAADASLGGLAATAIAADMAGALRTLLDVTRRYAGMHGETWMDDEVDAAMDAAREVLGGGVPPMPADAESMPRGGNF